MSGMISKRAGKVRRIYSMPDKIFKVLNLLSGSVFEAFAVKLVVT